MEREVEREVGREGGEGESCTTQKESKREIKLVSCSLRV